MARQLLREQVQQQQQRNPNVPEPATPVVRFYREDNGDVVEATERVIAPLEIEREINNRKARKASILKQVQKLDEEIKMFQELLPVKA